MSEKIMQVNPRLLNTQIWTMHDIFIGSGSMSNQSAFKDRVIQARGLSQTLCVVLILEACIILSNLKISESWKFY